MHQHTISSANTYTVTATAANGCTDTESITVTSNTTAPTASAGEDFSITCTDYVSGRSLGIGDDALNYWDGSSSSWTNGADKGSSMNAWAITTGGSTGVFTGSPGNNGMSTTNIGTRAFGLYATGGDYVNATAELASAMAVGDELTFYWAINWDANGGGKGFDFKASGTTVYTVLNGGSSTITAGGVNAETSYGVNAMKVTLVRTSSTEYSFTMTKRSSGSAYTYTHSLVVAILIKLISFAEIKMMVMEIETCTSTRLI